MHEEGGMIRATRRSKKDKRIHASREGLNTLYLNSGPHPVTVEEGFPFLCCEGTNLPYLKIHCVLVVVGLLFQKKNMVDIWSENSS